MKFVNINNLFSLFSVSFIVLFFFRIKNKTKIKIEIKTPGINPCSTQYCLHSFPLVSFSIKIKCETINPNEEENKVKKIKFEFSKAKRINNEANKAVPLKNNGKEKTLKEFSIKS